MGNLGALAIKGAESYEVGASAGIFAVIGSFIGYLMLNWDNLNFKDSPRYNMLFQLMFILIMAFVINSSHSSTAAHLSAFFSGILIGSFMSPRFQNPTIASISMTPEEHQVKNIGMGMTFALAVVLLIVVLSS